jgi:hypothetical protein
MRKCVLIAAMAGAMLSAATMLYGQASAMTISTPAGLLSAAADVNPVENVWCSWRGCLGGPYWGYGGPRPYWGYPGYYPHFGFYRPFGFGWHRRWF